MESAIPQGAYTASILVLLWSAFCLGSSILLAYMLFTNGERTNYVTLIACVVCLSSTASIVQQIYYACEWRMIKTVAWQQAKLSVDIPTIAFGPLSTGFNLALFEIQFVCYSISALLILFWAIALARGVYNLRLTRLAGWETTISTTSKVIAFVLPAIFIGVASIEPVKRDVNTSLALNTILILGSFALGALLMIATSIQYIRTRRMLSSVQGTGSLGTNNTSAARSGRTRSTRIKVDKVLLLRFGIAFIILAAFEVTLVCFVFTRTNTAAYLANEEGPDYSTSSAVAEILLFLPGVTDSLIAFLLFGTTAQFRMRYREFFQSLRCARKRRPSLPRAQSGLDVWETLDSGEPMSTYRCTVRSGDVESVELSKSRKSMVSKNVEFFQRPHGQVYVGNAGRSAPDHMYIS